MKKQDYPEMSAIYEEGIATKNATFQTNALSYEEWDRKYLPICRLVAVQKEHVVGFAALLPFSSMPSYRGVAELSIYVSSQAKGKGMGSALMDAMITASEEAGIWTLQSLIFPENRASIHLHEKFDFQTLCIHEKLGEMDGVFRDVALMERRSKKICYT
ncbi:GNAT family N-acetyltransferase [Listeria costaricensis]|uniref:GNAT family N-acetyltransferase n=1 Tax=Listeria costaricensis TaxID=2026604 RepID=UPI000C0680DD|nr:GNAT family N-acetyltransferase [Listeria costaricensis]